MGFVLDLKGVVMAKGGKENLVVPTSAQARINGAKGGKASAESYKRRKKAREQLEMLLSLPLQDIKDKNGKSLLQQLKKTTGLNDKEIDNQMAMLVTMWKLAVGGKQNSVQAFNSLMSMVGENVNAVQINKGTSETIEEIDNLLKEDANTKTNKCD